MTRRQPARLAYAVMVAGLLVWNTSAGAAQAGLGVVTGTVEDSDHGVIPGATVALTNPTRGTSVNVMSDASGGFAVADVAVGTYTITIRMPGFKTLVRQDIRVGAGEGVALGVVRMPRPTPPGVYWTYAHLDGQVWLSAISQSQIESSPPWRESDARMTLSPNAAIRSARRALARITTNADAWGVGDVTPRAVTESRRIYAVSFTDPPSPSVLTGTPTVTILVLMSGVAIEPVELGPDDVIFVVAS
jgi:hypothetical protein